MGTLRTWLFAPCDNAQLIVFRISFGFLLAAEAVGQISTHWAEMVYVRPERTFPMPGFEWLQPLPGIGMVWLLLASAGCGALIMLGAHFRAATAGYLVMWTYGFLTQTTAYNNHHYFIVLLLVLMLLVPANAACAWDAKRRPHLRSLVCPRWAVAIFVAQVAILYIYGGIAKLYPDWFEGRPVAIWFRAKRSLPVIGELLQEPWFHQLIIWGGIVYDLLIVPALLWKRTRWLALAGSLAFHLFNSYVFRVGVFPYLSLALLVFFFSPEGVGRLFLRREPPILPEPEPRSRKQTLLLAFLALWFAVQVAVPSRHHLYDGAVHWTENGHRFSWLMMSRAKSGMVRYEVIDPASNRRWLIRPEERLTPFQGRLLPLHPDRIWQMAQRLAAEFRARGVEHPRVFAHTWVSVNGHPYQPLIDSTVDLAAEDWPVWGEVPWIVPLRER